MITIEEIISDVEDVAPLPKVVMDLVNISQQPEPDIREAIDVIKYDQALTTRILRYANSPMADARYRIQNIKDAAIRLGLGTLLEIALGSKVNNFMNHALPQYGLGEEEIWQHSKISALAAEVLQRNLRQKLPPTAFTAVLLHDIGKLILARHLDPDIVAAIEKSAEDNHLTHHEAEKEILGFTHSDVGARLATHWHLGDGIAEAIAHHHTIDIDRGPICDIVHVCNVIAKTVGSGLGLEGMNLNADPVACERLKISRDLFEYVTAEVASLMSDISLSAD